MWRWSLVPAIALFAACGSGAADVSGPAPSGQGTLSMALRSEVGDVAYRLRDGVFEVRGPESVLVSTEDDLDAGAIEQSLVVGDYEMRLQTGWRLERRLELDFDFETIEAEVVTEDPILFSVEDGQTTDVAYEFLTDGAVVRLERGSVRVTLRVRDESNPGCGDGVVDPGEQCDGEAFSRRVPPGTTCNDDCTLPTFCGDGLINGAEECEPGQLPPGTPAGVFCRSDCTLSSS